MSKKPRQRLDTDIRKLERKGYRPEASQDLVTTLVRGLMGFLYNCPLDMLIEIRLSQRMPQLSASQFVT